MTASSRPGQPAAWGRSQVADILPAVGREHSMEVGKSVESRVATVRWVWKPVRRDSLGWGGGVFWHPINSRMGWSSGTLRALSVLSSFTSHQY